MRTDSDERNKALDMLSLETELLEAQQSDSRKTTEINVLVEENRKQAAEIERLCKLVALLSAGRKGTKPDNDICRHGIHRLNACGACVPPRGTTVEAHLHRPNAPNTCQNCNVPIPAYAEFCEPCLRGDD